MALEVVDCGDVVGVHNTGADEAAEDLGDEVDGETPPWKLAEKTVAECYGRVQVCA